MSGFKTVEPPAIAAIEFSTIIRIRGSDLQSHLRECQIRYMATLVADSFTQLSFKQYPLALGMFAWMFLQQLYCTPSNKS